MEETKQDVPLCLDVIYLYGFPVENCVFDSAWLLLSCRTYLARRSFSVIIWLDLENLYECPSSFVWNS